MLAFDVATSREERMTAADAARTRGPGRPAVGRTEPLERDEIVTRASEIVRTEGLEALSMRRLSKDLGVTPMAIYHHIPDKPALMHALIQRVWDEVLAGTPRNSTSSLEFIIAISVRTREVWLANHELVHLAAAVFDAGEELYSVTAWSAQLFKSAGFPDVALAYSAVQNFTMGSIQTAASRRTGSAYFGLDPKAVLTRARRTLTTRHASDDHRGVLEARFDEGDELHFEPALRALIAGLLQG
jgi:TetR/AcrR family transcriptional regulator, tetracycline repressor protein